MKRFAGKAILSILLLGSLLFLVQKEEHASIPEIKALSPTETNNINHNMLGASVLNEDNSVNVLRNGSNGKLYNLKNVVIFVDFADSDGTWPSASDVERIKGVYETDALSLSQYINRITMGNVGVSSDFFPMNDASEIISVKVSKPKSYYMPKSASNPDGIDVSNVFEYHQRESDMLWEAANQVNAQLKAKYGTGAEAFNQLDVISDSFIDSLNFVVHADPIPNGGILWPHKYQFHPNEAGYYPYFATKQSGQNNVGLFMGTYTFMLAGENSGLTGSEPDYGTISHEFMHVFGFPEMYNSYVAGDSVGSWDVMSHTQKQTQFPLVYTNLNYWGKVGMLNAFLPTMEEVTTSTRNVKVKHVTWDASDADKDGAVAIKIKAPSTNSKAAHEYFVAEFRKKGASGEPDAEIPGNGLILYRVKDDLSNTVKTTPAQVFNKAATGLDGDESCGVSCGNMFGPFYQEVYVFRDKAELRNLSSAYPDWKENIVLDEQSEANKKNNRFDTNLETAFLSAESNRTTWGKTIEEADGKTKFNPKTLYFSDGTNSGIVIKNISSAAGEVISFDIEYPGVPLPENLTSITPSKKTLTYRGDAFEDITLTLDGSGNYTFAIEGTTTDDSGNTVSLADYLAIDQSGADKNSVKLKLAQGKTLPYGEYDVVIKANEAGLDPVSTTIHLHPQRPYPSTMNLNFTPAYDSGKTSFKTSQIQANTLLGTISIPDCDDTCIAGLEANKTYEIEYPNGKNYEQLFEIEDGTTNIHALKEIPAGTYEFKVKLTLANAALNNPDSDKKVYTSTSVSFIVSDELSAVITPITGENKKLIYGGKLSGSDTSYTDIGEVIATLGNRGGSSQESATFVLKNKDTLPFDLDSSDSTKVIVDDVLSAQTYILIVDMIVGGETLSDQSLTLCIERGESEVMISTTAPSPNLVYGNTLELAAKVNGSAADESQITYTVANKDTSIANPIAKIVKDETSGISTLVPLRSGEVKISASYTAAEGGNYGDGVTKEEDKLVLTIDKADAALKLQMKNGNSFYVGAKAPQITDMFDFEVDGTLIGSDTIADSFHFDAAAISFQQNAADISESDFIDKKDDNRYFKAYALADGSVTIRALVKADDIAQIQSDKYHITTVSATDFTITQKSLNGLYEADRTAIIDGDGTSWYNGGNGESPSNLQFKIKDEETFYNQISVVREGEAADFKDGSSEVNLQGAVALDVTLRHMSDDATDINNGAISETETRSLHIDTQRPAFIKADITADGKLNIQVNDEISGVDTIEYKITPKDSSEPDQWTLYDKTSPENFALDFVGTIVVKITDKAQNVTLTDARTLMIADSDAPTFSGEASGDGLSGNWIKGNADIQITAQDVGRGLKFIEVYTSDGILIDDNGNQIEAGNDGVKRYRVNYSEASKTLNAQFVFHAYKNGTYKVTCVDWGSNPIADDKEILVTKVDNIIPTLSFNISNESDGGKSIEIIAEDKDGSDVLSGIQDGATKYKFVSIDTANEDVTFDDAQVYLGTAIKKEAGYVGKICAITQDNVGNISQPACQEVAQDKSAPQLDTEKIVYTPNGWTNQDIEVDLPFTENSSGIKKITVESSEIDGLLENGTAKQSVVKEYTSLAVLTDTMHITIHKNATLTIKSEDYAGNMESFHITRQSIDTQAPNVNIKFNTDSSTPKVEIIAKDNPNPDDTGNNAHSGIDKIYYQYRNDGSAPQKADWIEYTGIFNYPGDTTNSSARLYAYALDIAGNESTPISKAYTSDNTPPVLDEEIVNNYDMSESGADITKWSKGPIRLTLNVSDDNAVASITVKKDGNVIGTPYSANTTQTTVTYDIDISENGTYQVEMTDAAQNSDIQSFVVNRIDNDRPIVDDMKKDGVSVLQLFATNRWEITFTAHDMPNSLNSGIEKFKYMVVDDGDPVPADNPNDSSLIELDVNDSFELAHSFEGDVYVYAVDHAGNVSDRKVFHINKENKESPSDDATLSDITLSEGSIDFSKTQTSYQVSVANSVSELRVQATASNSNATIKGIGSYDLEVGKNTIEIIVTAEDGTTKKTYTIEVTRAHDATKSSDAALKSLTISKGTLTPVFKKDIHDYRASVDNDVDTIKISAAVNDEKAVIQEDLSKSMSLSEGTNKISIHVEAEDGTVVTYTLEITRASSNASLSSNADLKTLSIANVTLTPAFDADITTYRGSVNYEISSLQIDASPADTKASVKGTGYQLVNVGENSYELQVSAEDGITKKTYKIILTREKEKDNNSKSVTIVSSDKRISIIGELDSDLELISEQLNNNDIEKKLENSDLLTSYSLHRVYDIYLKKDGKKYDLDKEVTVRISLNDDEKGDTSLKVIYIDEDGKTEFMPTTVYDTYVEFTTSHFSNYAIISEKAPVLGASTGDLTNISIYIFAVLAAGGCIVLMLMLKGRQSKES